MPNDVVLCAFNCSAQAPCVRWANTLFNDPPTVKIIQGTNSSTFKEAGSLIAGEGLERWLGRHKLPATRVAVVTFSAGWGFAHSLLESSQAELIDSVIVLDGIHSKALDHWSNFAARATRAGGPMLAMFHSRIIPPGYPSTRETNRRIVDEGIALCVSPGEYPPEPLYLTRHTLPAPVHHGNRYGHRTFLHEPLAEWEAWGGLYRFEYDGNDAPIHIYIAQTVQPRAWQLLADRWNGGTGVNSCVTYDAS